MGGRNKVYAYTDGSTQYNPGMGGYASIIVDWNKKRVLHKHSEFIDIATNNQVELLATIYSVEWFLKNYNSDKQLIVMSDSKYCTIGFNQRMHSWSTRDWKTVKGYKIANFGLWTKLYDLSDKGNIHFQWIKGHNGNKFNELADVMSRDIWQKKFKKRE